MIRQLDDKVMVSGQVAPHEIAGLAEQGITVLVNNRPDGDEAGQPQASEIEAAGDAATRELICGGFTGGGGSCGHRLSLCADHAGHRTR